MKRNCKAVIEKGDLCIRQSMAVYPTAWADITIGIKANRSAESKVYELEGELIEVSGDKGCISLQNGILLSVPIYCIRLMDT